MCFWPKTSFLPTCSLRIRNQRTTLRKRVQKKACHKKKCYQVVSYLFNPVVSWQCFNMPQPGLEVDAVMPWTLDTMKVDECFNRVHLNFGFNKTAELVVCSRCCWMLFWTPTGTKGIRVLVLHLFFFQRCWWRIVVFPGTVAVFKEAHLMSRQTFLFVWHSTAQWENSFSITTVDMWIFGIILI